MPANTAPLPVAAAGRSAAYHSAPAYRRAEGDGSPRLDGDISIEQPERRQHLTERVAGWALDLEEGAGRVG